MPPIINLLITIIITLSIIGFLVTIHELGHFLAAKLMGVRIEKFAIGFGPVLFSKKSGNTEYSLRAVPLGGYVQMFGDLDATSTKADESLRDHPDSYLSKNAIQKLFITIAGPLVNFIFGAFMFIFYLALVSNVVPIKKIGNYQFAGIESNQVAILLTGDFQEVENLEDQKKGFIISMNDKIIKNRQELVDELEKNYNNEVDLELMTEEGIKEVSMKLNGDGIVSNLDLDFFPQITSLEKIENPGRLILMDFEKDSAFANGSFIMEDSQKITKVPLSEGNQLFSVQGKFIMSINETQIYSSMQFNSILEDNLGKKVLIGLLDSQTKEINYLSVQLPKEKKQNEPLLGVRYGFTDVGYKSDVQVISYSNPLSGGIMHAVNSTGYNAYALVVLIDEAFQGKPEGLQENVGSVITVGSTVGQIIDLSQLIGPKALAEIINLIGVFSTVLAFMNILPIPLLDGGNLVIISIEGIRGKPLPEKMMNVIYSIFFVLLVILMIVVLGFDLLKIGT